MTRPTLKSLWPIFAFVAIFILAVTLRINVIELRDYWYDEAFTGLVIRQPFEKMTEIILNDVHPPMYYWLLDGWSAVAGDGAVALRLFSVLFGVLTVALAFVVLRKWFPKSWAPAVLGAFAFAINPFLANYSQEARMYTLLGFLLLSAAALLWMARATRDWRWRLAYSVVAALILLTHYLGFIFMLGFFLYDAWQEWKLHPTFARKHWKEYFTWKASSYGIPFVVGLAWLPFFLRQATVHNTLGWVPKASLSDIPLSLHKFLFGAPVGVPGVPPALGYRVEWLSIQNVTLALLIAIVTLVVYLTVKKKWDPLLSFLGWMAAFPLLLTWAVQAVELQLYVERFLSGTAIFLTLFLVVALYKVGKTAWLIPAIALYAFLVVLVKPWSYDSTFPQLASIAGQYTPTTPVVFTSPFDFTVARFYLGETERPHIRLYNAANPQEDLSSWAIIDAQDQVFELPSQAHIVITPDPGEFSAYQEVDRLHQFSVLKK